MAELQDVQVQDFQKKLAQNTLDFEKAKELYPEIDDKQIEESLKAARKNVAQVLNNSKLHYLKSYLNEA